MSGDLRGEREEERETGKEKRRERGREKHRQRDRERQRQRDRDREREGGMREEEIVSYERLRKKE